MISLPQNKAINVPVTKNGPNGISLFRPFLLARISPIPIIAPKKKAKNRATRIFGKPRKRPIKKANFTSPQPIHFPLEIKIIARKKPAAPRAEYTVLSIWYAVYWLKKILDTKYHMPDTKIAE